jgi:hypothetical protein
VPSTSARQHRFFAWIEHTPGAAKKAGVPKHVAHDFVMADVGRKFAGKDKPKPRGKKR